MSSPFFIPDNSLKLIAVIINIILRIEIKNYVCFIPKRELGNKVANSRLLIHNSVLFIHNPTSSNLPVENQYVHVGK